MKTNNYMKDMRLYYFFVFIIHILLSFTIIAGQTHIPSDPYNLIITEKNQFEGKIPTSSNTFRPFYFHADSVAFSFNYRNETYYNDNAPNQENMDVRYFSKGIGNFNSINFSLNSPYFSFMIEPYLILRQDLKVNEISRNGPYSVLNDYPLSKSQVNDGGLRNFLTFIHYKGLGVGLHKGNRWWGPGAHSSFQMTNNTTPFMGQIIGTINELRFGRVGIYALYTFAKLNDKTGNKAEYFTSLNGQITWYSSINISIGFSRNYLTGVHSITNYRWKESDARKIVFEGFLTSNLMDKEYTVGGHDVWDQTISGYVTVVYPKRNLKVFAEIGFNDNKMYFADFLSQPDHSMATIFGIRDYGLGTNFIWGFEWINMMESYSSRHRPTGSGNWYNKKIYDYSTYNGRRWGAHSGIDSDDWYLYAGYFSDKLIILPGVNYERHGIVSHRPAEVKIELRLDSRLLFKNIWFGIYYEKQFEAFLGFPDYYYEDKYGNPINASSGALANRRKTNTLIFSLSKTVNF